MGTSIIDLERVSVGDVGSSSKLKRGGTQPSLKALVKGGMKSFLRLTRPGNRSDAIYLFSFSKMFHFSFSAVQCLICTK